MGSYKADKKHGQGEYRWASGNSYIGNFIDDKREGQGIMKWIDGTMYKGNWQGGVQHGEGEMQYPDGSVKKGIFRNNTLVDNAPPTPKTLIPSQSSFKKKSSFTMKTSNSP